MNDIFSLKRFSISLRRPFVEKGVRMFGSILIVLMVILLFMNISVNPQTYLNVQMTFLILGLMFGPVIYMSVVANEFTNQSKGISYLLLPSSRFEKWLLNNVVVIGLYFLTFSLLFRLIEIWMIGRLENNFDLVEGAIQPISFDSIQYQVASLVGIGISLGILIGSHYFKKNSLVISLLIMFGLFLFVFISDHVIANSLFDGNVFFGNSAPFGSIYIHDSANQNAQYYLEIDLTPKQTINYVFLPVLAILSLTHYVRLKEKQL